jgi:hypothetical protein
MMILYMAQARCFITKLMFDVSQERMGIGKLQCVRYMYCIFHVF